MRKARVGHIPRISADKLAQNLKRSMGHNQAHKMASNLAKNLSAINAGDFNHEIFKLEDIRKGERFWTQVRNILAK